MGERGRIFGKIVQRTSRRTNCLVDCRRRSFWGRFSSVFLCPLGFVQLTDILLNVVPSDLYSSRLWPVARNDFLQKTVDLFRARDSLKKLPGWRVEEEHIGRCRVATHCFALTVTGVVFVRRMTAKAYGVASTLGEASKTLGFRVARP